MAEKSSEEAARIEGIWGGEFGNEYAARNPVNLLLRQDFWRDVLTRFPVRSLLEVGCNLGANIRPLSIVAPEAALAGIDINAAALAALHRTDPGVRLARASARALPFTTGAFDMVFTVGVLIHQPPEMLPEVVDEIVRCSRRYVLCAEYYSPKTVEVPYRGQTRALFKGDFGGLYRDRFGMTICDTARLVGPGWDDVTCWILEKTVRTA